MKSECSNLTNKFFKWANSNGPSLDHFSKGTTFFLTVKFCRLRSWLATFIAIEQIKFTMIFVDKYHIYELIRLSSTKAV